MTADQISSQQIQSVQFVHELFEQTAYEHPQAIAVIFGDQSLSYQDLSIQSTALANLIINQTNQEDIIGISATRSLEMVIALLAILKSGKAYLPLDPTYPKQRLEQIKEDSGVLTIIALSEETSFFKEIGLQIIQPDQNLPKEHLNKTKQGLNGCVLYTSGSTGRPKGVCLGHEGLTNFLRWQQKYSICGPGIHSLQFCHLSFDASFMEIFLALTTGSTLYLITEDDRLDGGRLLDFIVKNSINKVFLPFVTLQYLADAAVAEQKFPSELKEVTTGGELLKISPTIRQFFKALPDSKLVNIYGPTEATVCVTTLVLEGDASKWADIPTIGAPMANASIFFLDEDLKLLEHGEVGELCISGVSLSNGYLNQAELTAEKFINWEHPTLGLLRIYRTGDLGSFLDNGEIDFIGRRDGQIKIRGNRVELGEIEVAIMEQGQANQCVVVLREDYPGRKTLVAYLVCESSTFKAQELRNYISAKLPDYMVPASFVCLDILPKTVSGKVDKKALPKPDLKRPELNVLYRRPNSTTEKHIANVLLEILPYDKIGIDDNFFELGGNSLLAQKLVSELRYQHNYQLPITKLYQFPTISGMSAYLNNKDKALKANSHTVQNQLSSDIAIIGMAGRFPGANSIEDLWDVLINNKETTSFFAPEEIDPFVPNSLKNDTAYVRARGIIDQADQFDPVFFGINQKLAELMDPQQRVFLEIAQEVLEKSGHLKDRQGYKIGVFAGSGSNTYYENNVLPNTDLIENQGKLQVLTVNEKDYIATRTAYHINLNGPAVSVNSACSTSLLAVVEAVNSLRSGQCDAALAGGSSVTVPVNSGHVYQEGSMLSADGHCKPFDDAATGTVFSDGAGVVLLKRLADAEEQGDFIYGVIRGVGVNNDGAGKGSFTAPSSASQADAIAMAISDAKVDPAEISYIEAHGTGTPLGDPIEFEGLVAAFGPQSSHQYCAIGSVKSNFGHLTQAAGVTGLIKTCLALHHQQIPASLGYQTPNRNINFKESPFYVNHQLADWNVDHKRIAGVSSFGVGGTNVHVVVEEYQNPERKTSAGRPFELISWSALTETSSTLFGKKLAEHAQLTQDTLADTAYTLQHFRNAYKYRRFAVADTEARLKEIISQSTGSKSNTNLLEEAPGEIVFSFPGQGAQYLNMGKSLYEGESVYREAIDACASILMDHIKCDIRDILFPEGDEIEAEKKLKDTKYTQPALFVTEYALAKLWMHWGITPTLFCGHSIGEYVAAHLSGVFSLQDALKLIANRGLMVSELPSGGMLSIRQPHQKIEELLTGTLSIAAINSPGLCVVAGPMDELTAFSSQLDAQEIANKMLFTSHAFHSSMMDPIVASFQKIVAETPLSKPLIPIISTVTGELLSDAEATDPAYWSAHLRKTVRFSDAISTILTYDHPLFLEVGPGAVTATLIKQIAIAKTSPAKVIHSLNLTDHDYQTILTALGYLWMNGLDPNWDNYYSEQQRKLILLPSYQFDRKRFWVSPKPLATLPINTEFPYNTVDKTTEINQVQFHNMNSMRTTKLTSKIKQLLEDASGIEMQDVEPHRNFLEIGLDSLLLTQVAISLKREFNLPITFRKLNEEYPSVEALVQYIDQNTAPDPEVSEQVITTSTNNHSAGSAPVSYNNQAFNPQPHMQMSPMPVNPTALSLIAQQLDILSKQVLLMQGYGSAQEIVKQVTVTVTPPPPVANPNPTQNRNATAADESDLTPQEKIEIHKPFGATPKIDHQSTELNDKQTQFLKNLTERYNKKTAKSKQYAAESRDYMADPRVVSGFKPLTKELVYPVVINKSLGSKMWDIDGNEYIDVLNGFGSNMLGYQPEFIQKALHNQIDKGFEVGPQHELAAEVSKLVCEFTGFDRSALCSTGSEAVLGCIRIARTVTGRSLIVAFSGAYHGIIDEVLVRGTKKLKSFPAAAGIMPDAVKNILVLDYGTDEALAIIKERAGEIAAVIAEPIQSRRPEYVPIDFLKQIREITASNGAALIFDEVITGFRMHPGGAQAIFGIKADLASYGKVVGAGIPIGVIAGKKEYMDALDGGTWKYGDHSFPEVGVTYFAGTFVRHPLALAAAKASLEYMKLKGGALQESLNEKGTYITDTLNQEIGKRQLPFFVANYGSLWKIKFHEEVPYSELMFTLMREKGIHVLDGFPCFITEATSMDDLNKVIECFKESMDEMINAGFFQADSRYSLKENEPVVLMDSQTPPVAGARLGKDANGNPAWFIADQENPGKYLQIK